MHVVLIYGRVGQNTLHKNTTAPANNEEYINCVDTSASPIARIKQIPDNPTSTLLRGDTEPEVVG